ncbi:MAG TPA: SpoIIE family protein phosphatase [Mycobacterium sp.]|uniref:SpoIIE family protein phosphatase n=1 Tax=Mycobacterium sp. TaxID=1785 RepID=UPI002D42E9CA|nr:SpoIIE family protein phosphatase [Mycobacterium sp.]HXY63358.1 SpoIIE family protein phosphatase [Mycobacterium sp.]
MSGHHRRHWRSEPQNLPPDLAKAVALGGEMGRLFAEFDWAAHPLGSPDVWSAEVRSAVAVVLTSRFPIALWLGAEDLFLVYNDAYIQILGDKHPAALGRRGRFVWWDIWEPISPMLASVIATGEATWSHDLMLPMVTAGRRQERYFTFTYSPLVGENGEIYGIFCPSWETTERVISERRLHLLNAVASATMETRTVDDAVSAAVSVCADQPADVPLVAAYVSGADAADTTLRGATPSVLPLLPLTLENLTHWQPTARSRAEVQIIENVSSVIRGLHEVLGGDCPDQALVLPLGENAIAGALVVGTNPQCPLDEQYLGFCQLLADQLSSALASVVSHEQQRQRADALAEIDRAKTAFLTNVSHEFRTPLTLLLGPLEDALSDVGSHTVLAERLQMARRNAGRLLRLVDSLLQFSRIEAGRATTRLVCTDVGALTSQIASSFTELCERAGLELVLDCRRALTDIDPDMWETVMLNLMSNAVKYTLSGSITVAVHSGGGQCLISVRDTGVGIGEADLKRLGQRFFRADTALGRSVEGTGIGLSLVSGLVELQHGSMQITSELDRGTTVAITLPKSLAGTPVDHSPANLLDNPYVVEADQWVAPLSTEAAPADDDRKLVLIADDNADMRAHLDQVLSARWRTVLVADGEAALRTACELRPDAIVTDVMMPKLDGFDFVSAIRRDTELAATPIIMLSARAGNEAVSEGYAGGADDYLPKPFRSQELVERVAARLSAANRERAGQQQREAELRHTSAAAQLDAALQAADSVSGIADALLASPLGSGGAIIVVIGLLDTEENNVRFEYAGPVPAEFRDRYHVATLDTPLVPIDVINTGQRMVITDTLALAPRYGHVVAETADSVRACVSQPLRGHDGNVIGSLGLLWPTPRDFDASELEMFARAAQITQAAVGRVRSAQREHRIAVEFQEHLLDLDRGSTAAVVAAVYQPGGEAMRVGGDWYLVAPLQQPGRIAVSVGDVVGHGLPAAIVMSRLRAAVSATALTGADPGAVLSSLDRYAAAVPGARCATVSYAVIDTGQPGTGDGTSSISYSCAGHPYPLLVMPDQAPIFLRAGRRPPVAACESQLKSNTAEQELPAESLLLLYTDGLIERPGETLDEGFARLQAAAAYRAELPIGDFCDELLDRMAPPSGYTDDVVLLAVRPNHCTARSFATVLPAAPVNIPAARHRLRDWLTGIPVDPRREADILLAIGEAVSNAIEHGSGGDSLRTVSIEAFVRDHVVTATVSDTGRWSGDSSASQRSLRGGRGLTMINGLADHVRTVRTAHGTRITLDFHKSVVSGASLVEGATR